MQLMRYGANKGSSWIGNTRNYSPNFFGLATLSNLLFMVETPSERVKLLREMCKESLLPSSQYVIRFRIKKNVWAYTSIATEVLQTHIGSTKRKWDDFQDPRESEIECLEVPPAETWTFVASTEATRSSPLPFFHPNVQDTDDESEEPSFDDFLGEDFIGGTSQAAKSVVFNFAFGEHSLAAVYERRASIETLSPKKEYPSEAPLQMIQKLLDQNLLQLDLVAQHLLHHFSTVQSSHGTSLMALGRIIDYYMSHLPHATVSMKVIKEPIRLWGWTQSLVKELDLLSPLAEQEARENRIPTTIYGNSLFIADQLLHDPITAEDNPTGHVSHVIGNFGKPGDTLLISPPELNIREHELERWQFVNHKPFDGESRGGMFDGTSLHLSFTGWEGPISPQPTNSRGLEAYYVETTISVNDAGEWVGDVDILKGLRNLELEVEDLTEKCSQDQSFTSAGLKMISIDCWEEILDPPDGVLLLRSTPAALYQGRQW
ncbi:unnamed protein product [Penicillium salamii]|nr:unnamed protein product [Penicillium salamii]CAG8363234.1 unnamed protein product [Penicillium salamii]